MTYLLPVVPGGVARGSPPGAKINVPVNHALRLATLWTLVASGGCGPKPKPGTGAPVVAKIKLAVLPAESDKFPKTAAAITDSLAAAQVAGIDEREVSKVSLEVVQLSIECVEPTAGCYAAVGKQLAANRLLFAQIGAEKKKKLKVTVTLFDVDTLAPKTAERIFANEKEATAGVADLVAEATR
jgi:hypothetical protein